MNQKQRIIKYLQKYQNEFSQEILVKKLRKGGFAEADIQEGVKYIYETLEQQKILSYLENSEIITSGDKSFWGDSNGRFDGLKRWFILWYYEPFNFFRFFRIPRPIILFIIALALIFYFEFTIKVIVLWPVKLYLLVWLIKVLKFESKQSMQTFCIFIISVEMIFGSVISFLFGADSVVEFIIFLPVMLPFFIFMIGIELVISRWVGKKFGAYFFEIKDRLFGMTLKTQRNKWQFIRMGILLGLLFTWYIWAGISDIFFFNTIYGALIGGVFGWVIWGLKNIKSFGK